MERSRDLGRAQREINVMRQAFGQEAKSGAKIDFVRGEVAATTVHHATLYLDGNTTVASEGFRVPAWLYVNVGDQVLAAVDYGGNLGKWIVEVLPTSTYSKIALNPNTGQTYTSDGTTTPTPSSGGGTTVQISHGSAVSAAADYLARMKLAADTEFRMQWGLDASDRGQLLLGPGGVTVPDVRLYRSGTKAVVLDDNAGGSTQLALGGPAPFDIMFSAQAELQIATNNRYTGVFSRFSADNGGPDFAFLKSRNSTKGSHTVVANNDKLGNLAFAGSDGSAFRQGAVISGQVDGTPGASDMPGRLVFSTTPDGSDSPVERLRIDRDGRLILGGSSGPQVFHGAATPEGAITAPIGSIFLRNDGGAATTLYVKESGTGNTGWVAVGGGGGAHPDLAAHDTLGLATQAELDAHDTDTTSVHGIADTSALYRSGGTDVAVADGGTGASTAAAARTNLGVGTTDSPEFTGVNVGHATDTTVTRSAAGDIAVEGNRVFRVGGADVPIADGGTGASTAATARDNLGIQTIRETSSGAITNGTAVNVTMTWPTAWADANYSVSVSAMQSANNIGPTIKLVSKSTTNIVVRVHNNHSVSQTFTLDAIGIHD